MTYISFKGYLVAATLYLKGDERSEALYGIGEHHPYLKTKTKKNRC